MKVYIANFGRENYLWPECLERGTIATMHDELIHHYWVSKDKQGYIDYCVANLKTARGISVTKPVASRWYNLIGILEETEDDLWIHREKDTLWWTTSTAASKMQELEEDYKPLRPGAMVYVFHKPCTGWSATDKEGRPLRWDGLHPKAKTFLFTEGTFQQLSDDNRHYATSLINGDELGSWHSRPEWQRKQEEVARSPVLSFSARERSIKRMVMTTLATVKNSGGEGSVRTLKGKELRFSDDELSYYLEELFLQQEGLCALTGIPLQLDGDEDDKQLLCSLDRIDSDGHYEPGNLQIVCRFINFWKGDQRNDEFRRLMGVVQSAAT